MSSIPPIEVPEDLPERHLFELERINALDTAHALEHRAAMNDHSCTRCWAYIRAMQRIADYQISPMMEATDRVARKLAEHLQATALVEATPEDFWTLALRPEGRETFRKRAVEIIELVGAPISIVPEEK